MKGFKKEIKKISNRRYKYVNLTQIRAYTGLFYCFCVVT